VSANRGSTLAEPLVWLHSGYHSPGSGRLLAGCPSFPGVCEIDAECITKCLNEVGSCGDIYCSFCDACDCASDPYYTCLGKCQTALDGSTPVGIDGSIP
jgi:hypothetical protein